MKIICIKIKNNETGLYSRGGTDCKCIHNRSWSQFGKAWTSLNTFKNHLNQYIRCNSYSSNFQNLIPETWNAEIYYYDKLNNINIIIIPANIVYPSLNFYKMINEYYKDNNDSKLKYHVKRYFLKYWHSMFNSVLNDGKMDFNFKMIEENYYEIIKKIESEFKYLND